MLGRIISSLYMRKFAFILFVFKPLILSEFSFLSLSLCVHPPQTHTPQNTSPKKDIIHDEKIVLQECPIGTFKNVTGSDSDLCHDCPPNELPHRARYLAVRGIT